MRTLARAMFTIPMNLTSSVLRRFAAMFAPRTTGRGAWSLSQASGLGGLLREAPRSLGTIALGGNVLLAWQEFKNKWECFDLFEQVPIALRRVGGATLGEYVARAASLGPYRALWVTEGLGHALADRACERGSPRCLLRDADLPQGSLTPLHSGMGLAFAARLLRILVPNSPAGRVRDVLRYYLELCCDNARDGYTEVAVEALGLVARNLHPRLVRALDEQLAGADEELPALFWHGVGRGLYFSPTNFLPSACWTWGGLEKAGAEPPHELGRLNAVAGLAWALTLVNIRHPGVIELFLARYGDRLGDDGAFANGVSSAALVWQHWASDAPHVEALCRHVSRAELAERWAALVRGPVSAALESLYPRLARRGLGSLFRYHPPEECPGANGHGVGE